MAAKEARALQGDPMPSAGPLCRHLRTKSYHLEGRFDPEVLASGSSAQYWCLHSMQSFGPDGEFVCPEDCDVSRRCFEE